MNNQFKLFGEVPSDVIRNTNIYNNKDWVGGNASVFKALGASNHTDEERQSEDFYATDSKSIDYLLEKATLSKNLWECACGAGHLSKRLEEFGYIVKSTDLVYRGYGMGGVDFFKCTETFDGDIITNPPYKYAQAFVEHALELVPSGRKVFMFLKLQFLEGKSRRSLFDSGQLKTLYVSTSRILCAKNGDFEHTDGSAVAYGWFEFERDYHGDPIIKWIN